jgi:hypothetical protein
MSTAEKPWYFSSSVVQMLALRSWIDRSPRAGLTFLLELCTRVIRTMRMHASVSCKVYDAVVALGTG